MAEGGCESAEDEEEVEEVAHTLHFAGEQDSPRRGAEVCVKEQKGSEALEPHSERVRKSLPCAKFPMRGLQARSRQACADLPGDKNINK